MLNDLTYNLIACVSHTHTDATYDAQCQRIDVTHSHETVWFYASDDGSDRLTMCIVYDAK
jgi:hypothetical protein